MKNTFSHRAIALLSVCAISTTIAFSRSEDEARFKGATVAAIEQNLAIGLSTDNAGLRASASQVVRNLKALLPNQEFSLLVIPLMKIAKDETADIQVRMIATLALHDLQSSRGDFTIERLAKFERNPRLKNLCTWLVYERLSHKESLASPASLRIN